jgi:hypothetical protein
MGIALQQSAISDERSAGARQLVNKLFPWDHRIKPELTEDMRRPAGAIGDQVGATQPIADGN